MNRLQVMMWLHYLHYLQFLGRALEVFEGIWPTKLALQPHQASRSLPEETSLGLSQMGQMLNTHTSGYSHCVEHSNLCVADGPSTELACLCN